MTHQQETAVVVEVSVIKITFTYIRDFWGNLETRFALQIQLKAALN